MKTKIKQDARGLYFRTGGYLFRPQPNKYSYPWTPKEGRVTTDATSAFKDGDEVDVRHVPQTIFGRVSNAAQREYWHGHGQYIDSHGKQISDTTTIWREDEQPRPASQIAIVEKAQQARKPENVCPANQ